MNLEKEIKNLHLRLYTEAAIKINVSYKVIHPSALIEYTYEDKTWYLCMGSLCINTSAAHRLTDNKFYVSEILKDNNIPVPEGKVFENLEEAKMFYTNNRENMQFVVKPNRGMSGKGVTLLPSSEDSFNDAYKNAEEYCDEVVVEEFVKGINYRITVLDEKVIAVSERVPAYVTGDGSSTIEELIKKENDQRKKSILSPINLDNELHHYLSLLNKNLAHVPDDGEKVTLRGNCNMCTGGVTIDKTDEIHPDNVQIAVEATKLTKLKFAGVDLITNDITESVRQKGGAINEINHNPDLRLHHYPYKGKVREVASDVQKYIKDMWPSNF